MSSYFYFTRHGQTIWNVENKICGATDIALTELGSWQLLLVYLIPYLLIGHETLGEA